jgi:phosphatidate cytidylyltransferase
MVLPRVLTSIFLVPIIVAVVWVGTLPFFLFVCAVCLFCLWEYSLIADEGGYPNQLLMSLGGGFLVLLSLYMDGVSWGPVRETPGPLFIFMFWTFFVFLREFLRKDASLSFLRIITTVTGVALFGLFLGHLLLIRELRMAVGEGFELVGRKLTFFLIFSVWMIDTGAWFVGRLVGRTSLAPTISPKKTWEGTLGGTLLACLVGWIFTQAFLKGVIGPSESVFYSILIAITAQASDLIESFIKRTFGVKDSSQLLPGHGGFLDRFDSFIFAAPFFYYFLIATGRFH